MKSALSLRSNNSLSHAVYLFCVLVGAVRSLYFAQKSSVFLFLCNNIMIYVVSNQLNRNQFHLKNLEP